MPQADAERNVSKQIAVESADKAQHDRQFSRIEAEYAA
jgi:hypothetical protein